MYTKSFFLSGIVGAIVYFLLGWLFYGVLFPEIHGTNVEPCLLMIFLGCLFMSLLVSLIYNRWASITISTGLKAGFVIGLLYTLSMNFFMYSSKELDTKFFILLAIESITLAIVGGVVGYMCGFFNDKNSDKV